MQMNSLMNWKEGTRMSSYNVMITEAAQRDLLDIFDFLIILNITTLYHKLPLRISINIPSTLFISGFTQNLLTYKFIILNF